jgi:hypothetical protein
MLLELGPVYIFCYLAGVLSSPALDQMYGLASIGQGCHGLRRIVEFAMLDDAPRDGLAREVGHAPDRLSPIAVILIDAFKIPPFEGAVVARDAVHRVQVRSEFSEGARGPVRISWCTS